MSGKVVGDVQLTPNIMYEPADGEGDGDGDALMAVQRVSVAMYGNSLGGDFTRANELYNHTTDDDSGVC